jgi:glycosyltransferase involved in cell wall biosynthesis
LTRVLWLIKGLGRGGAEQLLVSAAAHRDRDRFRYEAAYVLPWKSALVGELEDAGVVVQCLQGARGIGWASRLRHLVREGGFDVVHVHSPAIAAVARVVLGRGDAAMISTEHNVWERYHRATFWANAVTFPRNDYVFAVSREVERSIAYPAPLRRLRMPPVEALYQGIDLQVVSSASSADGVREEFGIPAGAPIVGTIANFKAAKGHVYLLEAARILLREIPEARFLLVGTGQLEDQIKAQSHAMGLDGRVLFAGFREDAHRLARSFDVYAASSIFEGLSIALLEAMSLGCPAVVTRTGGFPEVVEDGRNGMLVPVKDPAALAKSLTVLLRDEPRRRLMGEAAKRKAAMFDIRTTIARTEQVYQQVIA